MKMPKILSLKNLLILIVVLVLGYALYNYSCSKMFSMEGIEDGQTESPKEEAAPSVAPAAPTSNNNYALKPVANPKDLLPKDANSKWGELNNVNASNVAMPDLLQAGYHIGLDTVGQSLRNANLQVRSDPVISKADIGPWHQSTIEPDLGRVPLEIGYGPK
jgi:hypothetical protein